MFRFQLYPSTFLLNLGCSCMFNGDLYYIQFHVITIGNYDISELISNDTPLILVRLMNCRASLTIWQSACCRPTCSTVNWILKLIYKLQFKTPLYLEIVKDHCRPRARNLYHVFEAGLCLNTFDIVMDDFTV